LSVSATTRPPRPGEVDAVDYHFLTEDDFQSRRQRGEFLECFEVFGRGHWYGTLLSEVTPSLDAGKWVVLEIDVQGAISVMQRYSASCVMPACSSRNSSIAFFPIVIDGLSRLSDIAWGRRITTTSVVGPQSRHS
jgi:guanylate kinase